MGFGKNSGLIVAFSEKYSAPLALDFSAGRCGFRADNLDMFSAVLKGLFDRIFAVVFAILFIQIPHIIQLYIHLLRGALAEAKRNIAGWQKAASEFGLSLDEYTKQFLNHENPVTQSAGKKIQDDLTRFNDYRAALDSIESSAVWEKPFAFVGHVDWELLNQMIFKPGMSFTLEAAIYGLIGMLFGIILFYLLRLPFKLLSKKASPAAPAPRQGGGPPRRMRRS